MAASWSSAKPGAVRPRAAAGRPGRCRPGGRSARARLALRPRGRLFDEEHAAASPRGGRAGAGAAGRRNSNGGAKRRRRAVCSRMAFLWFGVNGEWTSQRKGPRRYGRRRDPSESPQSPAACDGRSDASIFSCVRFSSNRSAEISDAGRNPPATWRVVSPRRPARGHSGKNSENTVSPADFRPLFWPERLQPIWHGKMLLTHRATNCSSIRQESGL